MRRAIASFGFLLSVGLMAASANATILPVNPESTYLHTSAEDTGVLDSASVALGSLGIGPGECVRLEAHGAFSLRPVSSPLFEDSWKGLLGVFSASDTLLGSSLLNRIPDAIDAGQDVITPSTFFNQEITDIPEDFLISAPNGSSAVSILVPPGATHLFFAPLDNFFTGNVDPNDDFTLEITVGDCDLDLDGFSPNQGDCDDFDSSVYPDGEEVCDGKDNDCDGVIGFVLGDEGDADGDGFRGCAVGSDLCACADCDDADLAVNPGALELPGNFVDENCDGDLGDCSPCSPWRNHGEYIRCVSQAVDLLVASGALTEEEGDTLVSSAARSDVGKKSFVPPQECGQ